MTNWFEGWYLKQQNNGHTLALIPGRANDKAFIQVVADDQAYNIDYPLSAYHKGTYLDIDGNTFSKAGIQLAIKTKQVELVGEIAYSDLTPLRSDIMGIFRFLPMECRHQVISVNHSLQGSVILNGKTLDFSGGKGYWEGDSGRSFPKSYAWVQCNAFEQDCSVMLSIARIPFIGGKFWGTIGIVWYQGQEYRFATYLGARIACFGPRKLAVTQGNKQLIIEIAEHSGHGLPAPEQGLMRRIIHEAPSCQAHFLFKQGEQIIFEQSSDYASCEFVG